MSQPTNQQILDAVTDVSVMLGGVAEVVADMADQMVTKEDFKQMQTSLERKISGSHTVNVRHHLETRAMIGDLNRKLISHT